MLANVNRQVFNSLDNDELGWACMAPIMEPLRGKDLTTKSQVYSELTAGQQVLFMFYAYYNHAKNSLAEFYWWSAYFLAQPNMWSEIKTKLRYFEDDDMIRLLEEIEGVLQAKNHPGSLESFDVSPNDLENDSELFTSVSSLNTLFHEITPLTLERIGIHIRNHPGEFVKFER